MSPTVPGTVERPTAWPCTKCGEPGVRNLGIEGFCALHLEQLYDTFNPAVFAYVGVGRSCGQLAPEFGPHYADLRCNACQATWVGIPGDACAWCATSYQRMLSWQAQLVLRAPDVEPADVRRESALVAWADRMWTAVKAGIIDREDAERALARQVRRVPAA